MFFRIVCGTLTVVLALVVGPTSPVAIVAPARTNRQECQVRKIAVATEEVVRTTDAAPHHHHQPVELLSPHPAAFSRMLLLPLALTQTQSHLHLLALATPTLTTPGIVLLKLLLVIMACEYLNTTLFIYFFLGNFHLIKLIVTS